MEFGNHNTPMRVHTYTYASVNHLAGGIGLVLKYYGMSPLGLFIYLFIFKLPVSSLLRRSDLLLHKKKKRTKPNLRYHFIPYR